MDILDKVYKEMDSSDARFTSKGKKFKTQKVSKKWLETNLNNAEIAALELGNTIGVTMKKGRGYAYYNLFVKK